MSNEPLLAVVTVCFNNRNGLASTLESHRGQVTVSADCQYIVIDGGSDDGTAQLVDRYRDVVTAFQSRPDRGIYHAMNKGIQLATAKYVMFLNAGDIWSDSGALEDVSRALRSKDPAWMVAGAYSLDGGVRKRVIENMPHSWIKHAYGRQSHCHQSTFVKRDILCSLGGFSEQYEFAGDFDLLFRLGLFVPPQYLDRVVVTYEGGGVSAKFSGRIPLLQHKVRCDRMQLGRAGRFVDSLYMRYQVLRRRLHPHVRAAKGSVRRKQVKSRDVLLEQMAADEFVLKRDDS